MTEPLPMAVQTARFQRGMLLLLACLALSVASAVTQAPAPQTTAVDPALLAKASAGDEIGRAHV